MQTTVVFLARYLAVFPGNFAALGMDASIFFNFVMPIRGAAEEAGSHLGAELFVVTASFAARLCSQA